MTPEELRMELYRKVKASERLPKEKGFYLADEIDEDGDHIIFLPRLFDPKRPSTFLGVLYWLELIEITKKEIESMLATYEKKWDDKKGAFLPLTVFQKDKIKGASKAIFDILKMKNTPYNNKKAACDGS